MLIDSANCYASVLSYCISLLSTIIWELVMDRKSYCSSLSPWSRIESDTTEQLNWNEFFKNTYCVLIYFVVVQSLRCVRLFVTPCIAAFQASLSSPSPRVCSNSCPLSRWCHPSISSSVVPFSSRLQPFPASGSFQMDQLLASGGQSIRASASASVPLMNIQGWFPLGLTDLISLLSKGLSRVFSSTTVWKH